MTARRRRITTLFGVDVSQPIIHVHNLSKRYVIGAPSAHYKTLRDALADTVRAAANRIRRRRDEHAAEPDGQPAHIWALRDVSFDVQRGEVVGVIGANGAGKTTLLKIISRITEPTFGEVTLRGRVASLLEVGTGFHQELTGRENVYLNAAVLGMKREEIDRKFDDIVEFAEVGKFLNTPVKRYSSGMGVRLAFAVAAHLEPDILVVDEVLAVGDLAFRKKSLGKMQDVSRQGRTVLFVSHDMNAIRRLCRTAIWLDKGRVRATGPVHQVVEQYETSVFGADRATAHVMRDEASPSARRFASVTLSTRDGRATTQFAFGDVIRLTVRMEGRSQQGAHFVEWSLNESTQGHRVGWGATHASPDLEVPGDAAEISFLIGPLPLAQGRYAFSLVMGIPLVVDLDFWHDAATFDIVRADPTGCGFHYSTDYASTVIPYDITIADATHAWTAP